MKELVQFLAQQLVNNPDEVDVKETQGDTASVLELRVAKEDLGRVIGKQGRTAKSIRTILNAVASRTNRKKFFRLVPRPGFKHSHRLRESEHGGRARVYSNALVEENKKKSRRQDRVPRRWVGFSGWR